MLPRPAPLADESVPVPGGRRGTNFEEELGSWFRANALRAVQAPPEQTNATWPEEPASARIPFLMF